MIQNDKGGFGLGNEELKIELDEFGIEEPKSSLSQPLEFASTVFTIGFLRKTSPQTTRAARETSELTQRKNGAKPLGAKSMQQMLSASDAAKVSRAEKTSGRASRTA